MSWLELKFGLENLIGRAPSLYRDLVFRQWPASILDLNPLDFSTWDYLKRLKNRLLPGAVANSRAEIISFTQSIWNNNIPQEMIDQICGVGFLNRLQQCFNSSWRSFLWVSRSFGKKQELNWWPAIWNTSWRRVTVNYSEIFLLKKEIKICKNEMFFFICIYNLSRNPK